jgi:hypothetical protein
VSLFEVDECILIDDEENYMCIIDIKEAWTDSDDTKIKNVTLFRV